MAKEVEVEVAAAVAAKDKTDKDKTKAKIRYLKRKKERRKINKNKKPAVQLAPEKVSQSEDDVHKNVPEDIEEEEEEEEEGDDEEVEPPTKKRKLLSGSVDIPDPEPTVDDVELVAASPIRETTQTAPPLQRFPLPVLQNAPSKSSLALQGLDRALVDAEIILASRTLRISTEGDKDEGTDLGLSEKMQKRLIELGIEELFAVQTSLLPFLLLSSPSSKALYQPYNPPRDVCVSAPTGSGKTLAYAVPIVEILSTRIITRLRALIVLPTRDLVLQVRETFEAISKGRGLKIATATGQHSFSHEQTQLVGEPHFGSTSLQASSSSSKVDILICTPGRLIDHLKETTERGFTLAHLRFLVIDEADRLLAQSFQDWLKQVLAATRLHPPPIQLEHSVPLIPSEKPQSSCQKLLFSATLSNALTDPSIIKALELRDVKYFVVQGNTSARVLNTDPVAIGAQEKGEGGQDGEVQVEGEESFNPALLDVVTERFTMPATLKEHMTICTSYEKPLVFFHLVYLHLINSPQKNVQMNALVFTKSAESTNRLVRLFEFFQDARAASEGSDADFSSARVVVQAYSSELAAAERKSILEKFKKGEVQILICSDLISRGIDISNVSHVISYDAPVDMKKYVHRVGRTARAGREGDAWTLVEEQEARHFKIMMKNARHLSDIKRLRIGEQELKPLVPCYEAALLKLKDVYSHTHSRA